MPRSQAQLEGEIDALNAKLGKINLKDLPIQALKNKLFEEATPADFILPHSIGADLLSGNIGALEISVGATALTFSSSTTSATAAVEHGLVGEPIAVIAGSFTAPEFGKLLICNAFGFTAAGFSMNAEVKTAHTGALTAMWIAARERA